jgi:hypothetical protein
MPPATAALYWLCGEAECEPRLRACIQDRATHASRRALSPVSAWPKSDMAVRCGVEGASGVMAVPVCVRCLRVRCVWLGRRRGQRRAEWSGGAARLSAGRRASGLPGAPRRVRPRFFPPPPKAGLPGRRLLTSTHAAQRTHTASSASQGRERGSRVACSFSAPLGRAVQRRTAAARGKTKRRRSRMSPRRPAAQMICSRQAATREAHTRQQQQAPQLRCLLRRKQGGAAWRRADRVPEAPRAGSG